jgi:hypothetical protein
MKTQPEAVVMAAPQKRRTKMVKTIKVALAGAGAFGVKHLDGIKNIDGVEVISLVGRELDATRQVATECGIPRVCTDLADSLAIGEVDAVILCTPTQLHAAQASACFEGWQACAGRNSAGGFVERCPGRGRSAESQRADRNVRPYPPFQSQPSMGAEENSGRRVQYPADGYTDLFFPSYQYKCAGTAP